MEWLDYVNKEKYEMVVRERDELGLLV